MAKDNERVVGYYDLRITAKTKDDKDIDGITVLQALALINQLPADARSVKREGAKQYHALADWDFSQSETSLLIFRSDREAPEPIFHNLVTDKLRPSGKATDEGGASSAHCLIRPNLTHPHLPALMLLEMRSALGTTRLCHLLTTLLKRTRKDNIDWFKKPDPSGARGEDGQPLLVDVNYRFSSDAHISDEARLELESGVLTGIELIEDTHIQKSWDSSGVIVEKKKSVLLGLKPQKRQKKGLAKPKPKVTMPHVIGILESSAQTHPSAKIRYIKHPGAPETTIAWSAESGLETKFVKKEVLTGFSPKLVSAYDSFHQPLLAKMKGLRNAGSIPTS